MKGHYFQMIIFPVVKIVIRKEGLEYIRVLGDNMWVS